jgi:hypothetical protein
MSLASMAQQQRAKHLSVRLDACIDRIDDSGVVKQHAVMYAAFLTDLGAGRMDAADPNVAEMVSLADEFCTLVETEYQSIN